MQQWKIYNLYMCVCVYGARDIYMCHFLFEHAKLVSVYGEIRWNETNG